MLTLRTTNFNIQELCAELTQYSCGLYEPHNKQPFFPIHHEVTGFDNREGECLLRGTD